jgi:protein-disulfide isomerase
LSHSSSSSKSSSDRNRRLLLLGVGAALAVVVVAVVVMASRPEGTGGTSDTSTVAQLFAGIDQDGLTLGDPQAPWTMTEYVDLQCPFCRNYTLKTLPSVIREFVRTGQLKLELRPIDILGPDSERGSRATIAAAQQNRAWEFADTFYRNQQPENSGYVTDAFIAEMAHLTPGLDAAALDTGSAAVRKGLDEARKEARAAGIKSTPSFVLSEGHGPGEPFQADFSDPGAFTSELRAAIAG